MHDTNLVLPLYFSCRSGSTFTGYLLSASSSAVYVFEPFQHLIVNGFDIEEAITYNKNKYVHAKTALEKVFNLDLQMLPGRWLFLGGAPTSRCDFFPICSSFHLLVSSFLTEALRSIDSFCCM